MHPVKREVSAEGYILCGPSKGGPSKGGPFLRRCPPEQAARKTSAAAPQKKLLQNRPPPVSRVLHRSLGRTISAFPACESAVVLKTVVPCACFAAATKKEAPQGLFFVCV